MTWMAEGGATLVEMKAVSGHKSDNVAQHYIEASARMKDHGARRLGFDEDNGDRNIRQRTNHDDSSIDHYRHIPSYISTPFYNIPYVHTGAYAAPFMYSGQPPPQNANHNHCVAENQSNSFRYQSYLATNPPHYFP